MRDFVTIKNVRDSIVTKLQELQKEIVSKRAEAEDLGRLKEGLRIRGILMYRLTSYEDTPENEGKLRLILDILEEI